jgi:hypothetical protein
MPTGGNTTGATTHRAADEIGGDEAVEQHGCLMQRLQLLDKAYQVLRALAVARQDERPALVPVLQERATLDVFSAIFFVPRQFSA